MVEMTDAFKKQYKMRTQGEDGLNTVVSIPRVVIKREAEKRGLSVERFIKRFRAVAHFDNFDGVFYAFEEAKEREHEKNTESVS